MKGWDEPTYEEIPNGYKPAEVNEKIILALSDEEIINYIREKKLKNLIDFEGEIDVESLKMDLKGKIWVKKLYNNPKTLKNQLIRMDWKQDKNFPKLFWEEYVYRTTMELEMSYREMKKHEEEMRGIKEVLDNSTELHGISGDENQNGNFDGKYLNSSFTMRAWGQLMAAYMNTLKGERLYTYMDFYM